tara:strand:+ start:630 stop:1049 length:420 start_codon:yes stop_codon:yes gene_type:complete
MPDADPPDTRDDTADAALAVPAKFSAEQKHRIVSQFVAHSRRDVSTTLRDMRDDDVVYVLLGHMKPNTKGDDVIASFEPVSTRATQDRVESLGKRHMGVRYCLDQIRELKPKAHNASDVIVGVQFPDGDIFTVIVRVAA